MAFKTDIIILLLLTHFIKLEAHFCRQSQRKEFVRLSDRNDLNKIHLFFAVHRCYHEEEISRYLSRLYIYKNLVNIWGIEVGFLFRY